MEEVSIDYWAWKGKTLGVRKDKEKNWFYFDKNSLREVLGTQKIAIKEKGKGAGREPLLKAPFALRSLIHFLWSSEIVKIEA